MKRFAKNYLKALGFTAMVSAIVAAFIGVILLPIWIQNTFGTACGLGVFAVYVLIFVGLMASSMDDA